MGYVFGALGCRVFEAGGASRAGLDGERLESPLAFLNVWGMLMSLAASERPV